MSATQKAQELGIDLSEQSLGYLNLCIRSGNQLITSGHVSDQTGVLGRDLSVDQGYQAAQDCARRSCGLFIIRTAHSMV